MRQHDDILHSEVFLHVMENHEKRKRWRLLRNKILVYIIAAVTIAGIMLCWFNSIANAQAATPELIEITPEPITVLSEPVTETEPVTEAMNHRWSADEAYLLAKIAMAEAEGEDTEGKALVILTVLNRVHSDSFPDTIGEVIFQEDAFTPVKNGRFDEVEPNEDCYAALALIENGWDESQGSLYFERTTHKSTWHSRNLEELFDHGNHTFYTEEVDAE